MCVNHALNTFVTKSAKTQHMHSHASLNLQYKVLSTIGKMFAYYCRKIFEQFFS